MWEHDQLRLLFRTLQLHRRLTASEYDRREFSRNLVEIYLEEEKMTIERLREHVDHVLAPGGEQFEPERVEVCKALNAVLGRA